MIHRFRINTVYGGEELHGGCGFMERHKITVLRRTKGWIFYKCHPAALGKKLLKARRNYVTGWGDFIIVPTFEHDEFHAYGIEPGISPLKP